MVRGGKNTKAAKTRLTRSSQHGVGDKSDAVQFLEKLAGGPLTFGRFLRSIREGEESTLTDFARALGVSRQNLCDVEQGRRAVSLERAAAWARALGYSEEQFLELALEQQARAAGLDVQITVRQTPKGRRKARRDDGAGAKKRASRG